HINTNINLRQKPSGVPILNKTNKFNNDKQFNINTAKSKMSWNDIKSNFESVNNVINNNNNKISSNSDDYDNYFNRHFKNAKKRDILDDFK
ncbi:hypothetical protein HOK68_02510, partial [Candidatus Woesearchaeota archaeon]|nr:hypothetical protein [Candidatus Woesearchaeota archaeon]